MAKRTQTRFIARVVEGAKPADMPAFIKPQLATLRANPPATGYVHEVKFDGYRIQAHLNRGRVTLYTRSGLDWTKRFGIAHAFDIPVERAIFDGEIVVTQDGRPSAEIEKYPRFKIAALGRPPAPHKRQRRTDAEVASARAAKEARKAARATRAIDTR
jgi:hypothetical protein